MEHVNEGIFPPADSRPALNLLVQVLQKQQDKKGKGFGMNLGSSKWLDVYLHLMAQNSL